MRDGKILRHNREELRPQDEKRYTTPDLGIVSKPIDSFVKPGGEIDFKMLAPPKMVEFESSKISNNSNISQNNSNTLLKILDSVPSVLSQIAKIQEDSFKKDQKQGYIDSHTGINESSSEGYIAGRDIYQAEKDSHEYSNSLFELAQKFPGMSQDDLKQNISEIKKTYLSQEKSNYYNETFIKETENTENTISKHLRDNQYKKERQDNLDNVYVTVSKDVDNIIERNISSQQKAVLLRENLSLHQDNAKNLGLSNSEISKMFVHAIGNKAIQKGDSSLLIFGEIQDKNGVKLSQTYSFVDLNKYKNMADNERERRINKSIQEFERNKEENIKSIFGRIAELSSQGDFEGARQYADNKAKTLGQYYFSAITNIHNTKPNPNSPSMKLYEGIQLGEISTSDLDKNLQEGKISQKDHKSLVIEASKRERRIQSETKDFIKSGFGEVLNNISTDQTVSSISQTISLTEDAYKIPSNQKTISIIHNQTETFFNKSFNNLYKENLKNNFGSFNPVDENFLNGYEKLKQESVNLYKQELMKRNPTNSKKDKNNNKPKTDNTPGISSNDIEPLGS